jgi:hypothetical protein
MKTYRGVEAYLQHFLTSALDGGEWLASRPCRFNPRGRVSEYTLNTRLGVPQIRSGRYGQEKNLTVLGIEPGQSSP